jgi:hypothetical protein
MFRHFAKIEKSAFFRTRRQRQRLAIKFVTVLVVD